MVKTNCPNCGFEYIEGTLRKCSMCGLCLTCDI